MGCSRPPPLARLYRQRPLLARLAFQLPLHDAGKDCFRALVALWDERVSAAGRAGTAGPAGG